MSQFQSSWEMQQQSVPYLPDTGKREPRSAPRTFSLGLCLSSPGSRLQAAQMTRAPG